MANNRVVRGFKVDIASVLAEDSDGGTQTTELVDITIVSVPGMEAHIVSATTGTQMYLLTSRAARQLIEKLTIACDAIDDRTSPTSS